MQNKAKRGSCSECRQRKIKCCRSRPCLNCISRNLTCSDSDDEQQMVQVKAAKPCNPVAFVACLQITAERVDQIAASAVDSKLNPVLVIRMAEAGFMIRPLLDILIRLPPSVRSVLDEWLPVLGRNYAKLSANANRLNAMRPALPASDVLDTPDANTGLGIDAIEDLTKCDTWVSITYDLIKGGRKFVKMGAGMADFFNCHREEQLARVAANELPLCCSDDQSGSISETACFECGIVTGVTMSDYRSAQTMRRSRAVRECRQKGESTSTSKQVPLSRACLTVLRFRLFFHSMPAAFQSCLQSTGPAHSRFLPPPAAPPSPPSPVGPRGRKSRAFRQASQAISCIR